MTQMYKAVEFEIAQEEAGFRLWIEGERQPDLYKSEAAAIAALESWVDSLEKLCSFGIV